MSRSDGLWVFIAVVTCNVIGLMFDLALLYSGYPMVTDVARRNPWVAGCILFVNALGIAGLAYHFWARNGG